MGDEALDVLNELELPLADEIEPLEGEVQRLTPTIDALFVPDIDESLDEQSAKQRFWSSFRARRLVRQAARDGEGSGRGGQVVGDQPRTRTARTSVWQAGGQRSPASPTRMALPARRCRYGGRPTAVKVRWDDVPADVASSARWPRR